MKSRGLLDEIGFDSLLLADFPDVWFLPARLIDAYFGLRLMVPLSDERRNELFLAWGAALTHAAR